MIDAARYLGEDYLGKSVPKLGFGLMRLPKVGEDIDVEQTSQMVDEFLDAGFSYFDTAWGYAGSEAAIKTALVDRHPRSSYTLATKNAAWRAQDAEDAKRQLDTSLERTGAGYFDFYLLHNLGDARTQTFEEYGLWEWACGLKEQGVIKHLGFSMHATADQLDAVLTAHPEAEFVQLQINYADWEDSQTQSRLCYETAIRHGKPVVIMEPVKGGLLANPPEAVADVFKRADAQASCASWALRFAASLPGLVTVLSGMSSLEQLRDNIATFQRFTGVLDEGERAVLDGAREVFAQFDTVACTNCKYCMKGCPVGMPIPAIFGSLNSYRVYGNLERADYAYATRAGTKARDCVACGACEAVCPQHLPIIELLKSASATFDVEG